MIETGNRNDDSDSVKFLLAEYQLLEKLRANVGRQGGVRVEIFFLVVTGTAAVATWISKNNTFSHNFVLALTILNAILLMIGLLSFQRILEAHFSIVYYTRCINRIRGYFLDRDNRIQRALLLPHNDSVPAFGGFGFGQSRVYFLGLTGIMMVLNAVLVSTLVSLMLAVFLYPPEREIIFFGIGVFFWTLAVMSLYSARLSREREDDFMADREISSESDGADLYEQ